MSQQLRRIVVVGASLAGLRAAERLRAKGFDGTLTVIGAEPHLPYDRPPLSKHFLTGDMSPAELTLRGATDLAADWVLGSPATSLDVRGRRVTTEAGESYEYDGLVLATGSHPRQLPGLAIGRPGILGLRTVDDAAAIREALLRSPRVLIVGSGFIGVELASTCRQLGLAVSMVSLDPPLSVAGTLVSSVTTQMLRDHDVDLRVGTTVSHTLGDPVEAAVLADGSRAAADLVVVAVGAAPATGWLEGSGLTLSNGVVCDPSCAAADAPGVVVAGDIARWPNPAFGSAWMRVEHWTNAVEQGTAAAATLLEGSGPHTAFRSIPTFWSDHFGVRLQSVGVPGLADRVELVDGTVESRRFAAALYRGDHLIAAIAYNSPRTLALHRAKLLRLSTGAGDRTSTEVRDVLPVTGQLQESP